MKCLVSLILALSLTAPAFSQSQKPAGEQTVKLGTTEVMLDVVVRDKKGRPVKDLAGADFEIFEDGVKQQIESFRLVVREGAAAPVVEPKKGEESKKQEPPRAPRRPSELNVIAMVFDRLSPSARDLARKAALGYVSERSAPDDFTGVFLIDLSLHTVQNYTDNQQLVHDAIERATTLATATYASSTEKVRNLTERSSALSQQSDSAAASAGQAGASRDSAGAGAAGGQSGQASVDQRFAEMNARMLENFEALERDQQGYATSNGLHAVVESLRGLPGRKTIIFFSEGLSIPPAVLAHFRSVIAAANRANVAIYAVDAAGLRVDSPDAEARQEVNSLANRRMRQVASGREDNVGPMSKQLERNEDLLRLNPHGGLGDLADQTGGLLIASTNDLSSGLKRVDEDLRAHYELTYVPKNTDFDGRFRQVAVKVNRSNLEVQSRKGYFAVNAAMTSAVLEYEAPAIAAMTAGRAGDAFPLRAAGLSFPEASRLGLVPVIVEFPANAFTYSPSEDKKTYKSDFSVVVLIRDESQQIVKKMSHHYQLTGPLDKIDAAKRGDILFYREAQLPAGKYSIEAIAYDAPTRKSSLKSAAIEVPHTAASNLRLSSIVLIQRADRLSASELQTSNPFHFGEVLLYPNTGEIIHKSAAKQLAFFFTAYTAKGAVGKTTFSLEILKAGKPVGETSGELAAADPEGRIQYASALPLDSFQPGSYELKVTVRDSQQTVSRSTPFTLEP